MHNFEDTWSSCGCNFHSIALKSKLLLRSNDAITVVFDFEIAWSSSLDIQLLVCQLGISSQARNIRPFSCAKWLRQLCQSKSRSVETPSDLENTYCNCYFAFVSVLSSGELLQRAVQLRLSLLEACSNPLAEFDFSTTLPEQC